MDESLKIGMVVRALRKLPFSDRWVIPEGTEGFVYELGDARAGHVAWCIRTRALPERVWHAFSLAMSPGDVERVQSGWMQADKCPCCRQSRSLGWSGEPVDRPLSACTLTVLPPAGAVSALPERPPGPPLCNLCGGELPVHDPGCMVTRLRETSRHSQSADKVDVPNVPYRAPVPVRCALCSYILPRHSPTCPTAPVMSLGLWKAWPTADGYWWVTVRVEGMWSRPVICACHQGAVASLGSSVSHGRDEASEADEMAGVGLARYLWAGLVEPAPPGVGG